MVIIMIISNDLSVNRNIYLEISKIRIHYHFAMILNIVFILAQNDNY